MKTASDHPRMLRRIGLRPRSPRKAARGWRPFLEVLEDRRVPAMLTQTAFADGYATDSNQDGVFDTLDTTDVVVQTTNFPSYLGRGPQRGLVEFNTTGLTASSVITSATLSGFI